jgi:hypothetical protein
VTPDTELILSELRELRADFNENARKTGERLASLETDMHDLQGNGQPGRVTKAEDAIQAIKQRIWWLLGAAAGVSGVVTCIAWIVKG